MIRVMEHLCCEDILTVLFFILQKRRLQGHLITTFQYLKGAYMKAGEGIFTGSCSDKRSFQTKRG